MTTTLAVGSFFCTELAHAAGEQIYGSAAETRVWLVLEYAAPWGGRAVEESDLPEAVKAQLQRWERSVPGARVQLIKKGPRPAGAQLLFYVGLSDEQNPTLYRFALSAYTDLLTLDLPALVQGDERYAEQRVNERLFLVCTNGKRDLCCAKWGLPVYQAMSQTASAAVWQTTHTGGHRFSATLVCLPHGLAYGWVEPDEAAPLIATYAQDQLYRLDRYRGRTCYDSITQVAEAFLREQTGNLDLAAYRHISTTAQPERHWQVQFQAVTNGATHTLHLVEYLSDFANPTSCSKSKGEQLRQYRLAGYQVYRDGS
jgi:hypothetical protein